jgi:hypothetical protein
MLKMEVEVARPKYVEVKEADQSKKMENFKKVFFVSFAAIIIPDQAATVKCCVTAGFS